MHDNTGIHVGFTGTQAGMNLKQKTVFEREFRELVSRAHNAGVKVHFHHGDCDGADEEAHAIVVKMQKEYQLDLTVCIHIHPPEKREKRAYCSGQVVMPEKPFLVRNHDIVDAVSLLFVAPRHTKEILRSGTWATKRYAVKKGIQIVMVKP